MSAVGGCSRSNEVISAQPIDPALAGRFFATAGETSSRGDLWEADFASGHLLLYRRTATERIGGIGACPTTLTVTNADRSAGFFDTLETFDGGTLSAIAGLDDPKASAPAVGPDCRLVFDRLDRHTDPPTDHLVLFDPASKAQRELFSPGDASHVLGTVDWGPEGRVAAFVGTAATEGHPTSTTGIVIIGPDGSRRSLPPPVTAFGNLQWGASKWIALSDEVNHRTIFFDPDSDSRAELAGWFPLAWSPDGQRLMVTDAGTRKVLGLVDAADLGKARVVGHAKKVSFFDFVWLPDNATAGGPPPFPGRRPDDGD
jgi:hypothetical protein